MHGLPPFTAVSSWRGIVSPVLVSLKSILVAIGLFTIADMVRRHFFADAVADRPVPTTDSDHDREGLHAKYLRAERAQLTSLLAFVTGIAGMLLLLVLRATTWAYLGPLAACTGGLLSLAVLEVYKTYVYCKMFRAGK